MKKQNNPEGYGHLVSRHCMKPLTSEIRYYKNFKLSQQHHGIKGLKK